MGLLGVDEFLVSILMLLKLIVIILSLLLFVILIGRSLMLLLRSILFRGIGNMMSYLLIKILML